MRKILVRTFPRRSPIRGKMREVLRPIKSKGLPAISWWFDQAPTKQPDRTSKQPRWPPGNIGQKRSGHERRRGAVRLGRCWPARPTIAASTQLCGRLRRRRCSPTNWGVWRRYFSHYVPILDFSSTRLLMYVYAAAMTLAATRTKVGRLIAIGRNGSGRGEVRRLLDALEKRQQELGENPRTERNRHPARPVANSLAYLTNQRERMKYDQYRKQGLPITSSPIESTVKQRSTGGIKGTEKFWDEGADPMLHLVADRLGAKPTPSPSFGPAASTA